MSFRKAEWPEVGDLVIGTVQTVTSYGAYVRLDEYDKEGLLHISEISSSWIRNIRNFVREGQKVVLKVLRVNSEKGHIDLSLRRVTKREKKEKLFLWKRERKVETLLRSVSERLKIPPEEIYEKVCLPLQKKFGGTPEGLEKVAKEGVEVLLNLGVPKKIAAVIAEIAKERIRIPMVKIKGILELQCVKPNGVNLIREALLTARKAEKPGDVKINLYVIAPPRYRIEVLAEDYKKAEQALEKATEQVIKSITKAGGQGVFRREK